MSSENLRWVGGTLDAAGEATDWISPTYRNGIEQMDMSIEASSDFSGTIILEKKYTYDGTTYTKTVASYTESTEKIIEDTVNGVKYRLRATVVSAGSVEAALYRDLN